MSTVVTEAAVLAVLARQGIDPESVELAEDYCAGHPRAKLYCSKQSDLQLGVFRCKPRVLTDGRLITLEWLATEQGFVAAANTISVVVSGEAVTVDTGDKSVSWLPEVLREGTVVKPKALLPVANGRQLTWDYGICRRVLQLARGTVIEKYIFDANPGADVVIKSNSSGNLESGPYYARDAGGRELPDLWKSTSTGVKLIPASFFAAASYPVEVDDSYTGDVGDGYMYSSDEDGETSYTMASAEISTINGTFMKVGDRYLNPFYYFCRSYIYFDTSAIPDDATIQSAAVTLVMKSKSGISDSAYIRLKYHASYPTVPLAKSDYNYNYWGGETKGQLAVSEWTYDGDAEDIEISDLATINKSGWTKYCVRASTEGYPFPEGLNEMQFYTANESGKEPSLTVTYTTSIAPQLRRAEKY